MPHVVRRSHERVPADHRVVIYRGVALGSRLGEGRLLDISLAGAYLLYEGALEPNTPYRLHAQSSAGVIDLPFRLARQGPRAGVDNDGRHYGLNFNLSVDQEKKLRDWMDYLRKHPPSPEEHPFDKSMRGYWEL